jgi:hypothetical protein
MKLSIPMQTQLFSTFLDKGGHDKMHASFSFTKAGPAPNFPLGHFWQKEERDTFDHEPIHSKQEDDPPGEK